MGGGHVGRCDAAAEQSLFHVKQTPPHTRDPSPSVSRETTDGVRPLPIPVDPWKRFTVSRDTARSSNPVHPPASSCTPVSRETFLPTQPRALTIVTALLVLAAACASSAPPDSGPATPTQPASETHRTPHLPTTAELLAATDRRRPPEPLWTAHQTPEQLATLTANRIAPYRDPNATLFALLTHPATTTRTAAARALARRPQAPEHEPRLLAALAAEPEPRTRRQLMLALGPAAGRASLPALYTALGDPSPPTRAAACKSLQKPAQGRPLSIDLTRVAPLLADSHHQVRRECTHVFNAQPLPADPAALASLATDLTLRSRDDSSVVRLAALRALARYPLAPGASFVSSTTDSDWRVAAQAFVSQAAHTQRGIEGPYLRSLSGLADRLLARPELANTTTGHVWRIALASASPFADGARPRKLAEELYPRFVATDPPAASRAAWARATCQLAAFLDRSLRWPKHLPSCPATFPAHRRRALEARLVASMSSSSPLRATYLLRLLEETPLPARGPLLEAAQRVRHPSLLPAAIQALHSGEPSLLHPAAQLAVALQPVVPPTPAVRGQLQTSVLRAIAATGPRAPVATWRALLDLIEAWRLQGLSTQLLPLRRHPDPGVRDNATRLLEQNLPDPDGTEPPLLFAPFSGEALPPTQLEVTTARGTFRIELHVDDAPAAARRIAAAATQGAYDNLTLEVSDPALALLLGDPRRPGPSGGHCCLRDEFNPHPFREGTVGLADVGPNTAGGALFITYADAPALDGRHTMIGQVRAGMEVVHALAPGERLISVRPVEPAKEP